MKTHNWEIVNRYKHEKWYISLLLVFVSAGFVLYATHTPTLSPCAEQGCVQKVEAAGPLTHEQIVLNSRHPKEIEKIWLNESSKGKNDVAGSLQKYCEDQGMTNEFGYGGMAMKWCYKDFQTSVNVVDKWLDTQTQEILCYYNIGVKTTQCGY